MGTKGRLAFTVYAGMRKQGWEQISIENVKFSVKDIRDKLIPVLIRPWPALLSPIVQTIGLKWYFCGFLSQIFTFKHFSLRI